jgi:hypothetical protein
MEQLYKIQKLTDELLSLVKQPEKGDQKEVKN